MTFTAWLLCHNLWYLKVLSLAGVWTEREPAGRACWRQRVNFSKNSVFALSSSPPMSSHCCLPLFFFSSFRPADTACCSWPQWWKSLTVRRVKLQNILEQCVWRSEEYIWLAEDVRRMLVCSLCFALVWGCGMIIKLCKNALKSSKNVESVVSAHLQKIFWRTSMCAP